MTVTWDILMDFGGGFTTIKADVRTQPVTAQWGIRNLGPTERVAGSGILSFTLDNSIANAAGTMGYYSPAHASVVGGFNLGTPVQIKVTDGGTIKYKKFYLNSITPIAGQYKERATYCTAIDYIGRMSVQYATGLTTSTSTTVDAGITSIVALMPVAPDAASYDSGVDTLAYLFHDTDSRRMTIYNMAQRLLQSDLGYLFCDMDATTGETLTYQTRHNRIMNASQATLSDTMNGLTIKHADDNIYNDITVISYPANVGSSPEVLYTLQREQEIIGSATVSFAARYRDPSVGSERIRLDNGTEVTPVAGTDYNMSSAPGGGSDLNDNLNVTVTWYADYADVSLQNTGGQTGYVNLFQLRGNIIRLYDAVESQSTGGAANLETYGQRPLRFSLPYQDNPNTAVDFGDHLLDKWGSPKTRIERLEFIANKSAVLYTASLLPIGNTVTVAETVTGVSASYWINGIEWTFEPGNIMRCAWTLEETIGSEFWMLGEVGFSELGDTTWLGF